MRALPAVCGETARPGEISPTRKAYGTEIIGRNFRAIFTTEEAGIRHKDSPCSVCIPKNELGPIFRQEKKKSKEAVLVRVSIAATP